jgi:murein DD-endopeptidase MepM/ murein hydrolase activator NlpD
MARRMSLPKWMLLVGVAALPLALFAVLPLSSPAQKKSLGDRIERKKDQIAWRKGRERVLASDVAGFTRRINSLQGEITTLQTRQVRLQTSLDQKRAELARIQVDLRRERLRLARLRKRLAEARTALAGRLVELYKADEPDLVTVVLESDGFADLLERTEFMSRVSDQDARIIGIVRRAKADAIATEKRLDKLEKRARIVAEQIEDEVEEVDEVKDQLVVRRDNYSEARSEKSTLLASTRDDRHALEGDLRELEAAQARITAALQAKAGGGGSVPAGPIQAGAGGLVWPVNGPIVSPFGMRWGRLHAGVDIAAPAGTPIRAAKAGSVVLAGWTGGYGNYVCISHGGGLSTCYAHLSSYATSSGASVSQGQVIGNVGCTGHCFGDHLHFETRVGGSPVNPAGYL